MFCVFHPLCSGCFLSLVVEIHDLDKCRFADGHQRRVLQFDYLVNEPFLETVQSSWERSDRLLLALTGWRGDIQVVLTGLIWSDLEVTPRKEKNGACLHHQGQASH